MLENGTHPIFQPGLLEQSKRFRPDLHFFLKISFINAKFQPPVFLLILAVNRQKFAYYENIFTIACEEQFIIFLGGFRGIWSNLLISH